MSTLAELEAQTLAAIDDAGNEASLENVRVAALGKKGTISAELAKLGKMSPDERKAAGAAINAIKDKVAEALSARRNVLKEAALEARLASETVDVTLPVRDTGTETGRVHPINQVMDELTAIFADMGFSIAEGPDVESDDYNFTKLNFPAGHPAREMHDTFFFNPDANGERKLLRTHTSPVQVRTMLANKPPIRVICPGRTYRCDSDQTHTPMFHQVEGLVIDKKRAPRPPQVDPRRILQGVLRSAKREDALPSILLSIHRTVDGSGHSMLAQGWRNPLRGRHGLA